MQKSYLSAGRRPRQSDVKPSVTPDNTTVKQLSVASILAYHLLPGVPILLCIIVLANPVWGFGLPSYLAMLLAIAVGLIPVQLGILAVVARRQNKKIRDIILFRNKMPLGRKLLWAIPILLFCIGVFMTLAPIEHSLWTIFDWVPDWFRADRFAIEGASTGMLWLVIVLGLLTNGIFGPWVEELYFRGFLLPRMRWLGKAAPFINVALFSLYHLFTPWENITRIIALTPMVWGVWRNKSISIGMIVHIALNVGSVVMLAIAMLG